MKSKYKMMCTIPFMESLQKSAKCYIFHKLKIGNASLFVIYMQKCETPSRLKFFDMVLDFYYCKGSAPCSAVQMTAEALGLKLNLKLVDLSTGEHLKPEFIKINPQHVVPTLVDDGIALWESRAIILYLIHKYGKDDYLYPSEPLKRALVNQRLFFDMGTLYQRLMEKYYPMLFDEYKGRFIPNADDNLKAAVGFLNTFLDGVNYVAGDAFTVADISTVATVSVLEACDFDLKPYPNVVSWYERIKSITPGYEINEEHAAAFKNFFVK